MKPGKHVSLRVAPPNKAYRLISANAEYWVVCTEFAMPFITAPLHPYLSSVFECVREAIEAL